MTLSIRDVVDATMSALTATRPIFHSESDFQHAFAWEARRLYPGLDVRLEQRLHVDTNERLDLMLRTGSERLAIELKYPLDAAEVTVDGETFLLKNQGATDLMRFHYVWDIVRVETMVRSGHASQGAAVLLTNVSALWSPSKPSSRVAADTAFRLFEGQVLSGELGWQGDATWWHGKYPESVLLEGTYEFRWQDYSTLPGIGRTAFRWMAIAVS